MRSTFHISEFAIGAFRSLNDIHLSDLGAFNLVLGGNNSGKTTVLEALGIYAAPMDLIEWSSVARMREARTFPSNAETLSAIEAIRWLFPKNRAATVQEEIGSINLRAVGSWIVRSVDAACFAIRGIPPEPKRASSRDIPSFDGLEDGWHIIVDVRLDEKVENQQSLFLDEPDHLRLEVDLWPSTGFTQRLRSREGRLRTVTLGPYSHRNQPLQIRALSRSIQTGAKHSIVEMLRGIDPELNDIEIVAGPMDRPVLLARHRKSGLVPVSVMGDGFRRALSIALGLYEARGGLLLVDEIETAFHVSVLDRVFPWLMRVASDLNVQVFATTHSLEAVQAIVGAYDNSKEMPVVAYHLNQEGEGKRRVKRYSEDMLMRLVRDRGLDIR